MQHRFHSACRAFRRAATFVTVSVCVWSLTSLGTAEEAGSTLENALEKLAGMRPALVIRDETLIGPLHEQLAEINRRERR